MFSINLGGWCGGYLKISPLCFLLKLCLHDLAGLFKSGFFFIAENRQGKGEPFGFVQADTAVGLHEGNTGQPCRAVLFQLLNFGSQCCVIQWGEERRHDF